VITTEVMFPLHQNVPRLRSHRDVFDDVIGLSGNRVAITAVVADLGQRTNVGLRKCFARVGRMLRAISR